MTKQSILITYADHGAKPPIYVAGDFTQWEPRELGYIYSLKSDNEEFGYKFFQAFEIEEGTYEYKFVRNNGQWVCSPMFEIGNYQRSIFERFSYSLSDQRCRISEQRPECCGESRAKCRKPR